MLKKLCLRMMAGISVRLKKKQKQNADNREKYCEQIKTF